MATPESRKRPHPSSNGQAHVNGAVAPASDEFHEKVVKEVLCRWWYCLPDWPPPLDWATELKTLGYREVQVHEWEAVEEVADGLRKVYPIGHYPGLFRNPDGKIVDCRPKDSCPSYNNMVSKSTPELLTLLSSAFANQIASLVKSGFPHGKDDEKLKDALQKRHEHVNSAIGKYGGKPTTKIPDVPEFPRTATPGEAKPAKPVAASPASAPKKASPAPKNESAPLSLPVESQPS